jgi:predicted DNA-binding transcriptional regulator AlpA
MPKKPKNDWNERREKLEAISGTPPQKPKNAPPLRPPLHCAASPRGPPRLQRIVRKFELPAFVGLRRTQIEELIKRGEFPKPVTLSDLNGRAKGWLEDELVEWQQVRIAARDAKLQQIKL